MKHHLFVLLLLLCSLRAAAEEGQLTAEKGVVDNGYDFWLYTPSDYEPNGHKLPLVLFLHGASLCGNNLDKVRRYGTIDAVEKGKIIPTFIVAPQNPGGSWKPERLNNILEWMEARYPVDTTRVYVLGMTLGGYGTLDFVGTYPEKVAAAMALCGGTTLKDVAPLGKVPLWIMHGTADRAVSIQQSKVIVNALQQQGNDHLLRYDWVKGGNHGILARLFYMQKTYDWLFTHSTADHPRTVARNFEITKDDIRSTYKDLSNKDLYEFD